MLYNSSLVCISIQFVLVCVFTNLRISFINDILLIKGYIS